MSESPLTEAKRYHRQYIDALESYKSHVNQNPGEYALFNVIRDLIVGTSYKKGGSDTREAVYEHLGVTETMDELSNGWVEQLQSEGKVDDDFEIVWGHDYGFKDAFALDKLPYESSKDPFDRGALSNTFIEFGRELYGKQLKVEEKARRLVSYMKFGKPEYGDGAYPYGHFLGTLDETALKNMNTVLGESLTGKQQDGLKTLAKRFGIDPTQSISAIKSDFRSAIGSMTYNEFYDDFLHGDGAREENHAIDEVLNDTAPRSFTEQLKTLQALTDRLFESHTGKMFLAEQFEKQYHSAPSSTSQRYQNFAIFPPNRIVDPAFLSRGTPVTDPHRERPFLVKEDLPKGDYFERLTGNTSGNQQYGPILGPGEQSPWGQKDVLAFNKLVATFVHGGWHYYTAYKTVTSWDGDKQYFGETNVNTRKSHVETFVQVYLSRLMSNDQLQSVYDGILSKLRSGNAESGELYKLAKQLGVSTNGNLKQVSNRLETEIQTLKSSHDIYDIGSGEAKKITASVMSWGWSLTDGTDWFDDATATVTASGKVGFSVVGLVSAGIKTYETLQSQSGAGQKAMEVVSLVNTVRGFVAGLGAIEDVTSLVSKGTLSEASAVKIAGKFAVVFNLYETIKNFCYSYSEYLDGDYDQMAGYAILGASAGCFTYAFFASSSVGWVPGYGQAVVLGTGLLAVGVLALAWATDSDLEEWVKYCHFGDSSEANQTKNNLKANDWINDTTQPYFGFKYPDNYLQLASPDEEDELPKAVGRDWDENFFGQISALATLARPIGLNQSDAELYWDDDNHKGVIKLKPDAAASKNSKVSQTGYIVIRPLSKQYTVQDGSPYVDYADDDTYVENAASNVDDLKKGVQTKGAQPPLHLIQLFPDKYANEPETETPLRTGVRVTHTIKEIVIVDEDNIKRWKSELEPVTDRSVNVFGFTEDTITTNFHYPFLEFIYLEHEQAQEMMKMDSAARGTFLDTVPAPREFRYIEETI
ncbi:hypothetical protein [Haloarchaeobius sp. HME9146]|uniref:hypothetical protein n=1 Tax=unclassified Haloarchaeobius TaxID=2614452 RepID=UPI0021C21D61|nr:hypothetical protein [Haloarchaeobius sp. HME9146]MCT9098240.1 hypothetical protein [Haloarchaeobius sp. HME9146]